MKRILVTGANGQLGLTLKELYEVNNKNSKVVFVTKAELDTTKKQELKHYFKKNQFDYCINCAAYTNVEQAEKTSKIAFQVNAEGVKYLAKVCKKTNTILIHISTDYVFDGKKAQPYTIQDIPNPINQYGKSKLLGEQYIQEILDDYFIVRTSWLYSKKYGNNFYRTILKKANTENELLVTNQQTGCPTNTVNLSQYIVDLIKTNNKQFGIYHFCDNTEMTWYDFAKKILKDNRLVDRTKLVKAHKYCTFANRPKYSVLMNTKTT